MTRPPPNVVAAVDFGGTKTAIALVARDGRIVEQTRLPAASDVDGSVHQMARHMRDAAAIGVIVPGIYTPSTGRAWCPNLWGPDDVALSELVREHVAAPVAIDSDRAGSVLGEAWLGAARGARDAVFVAIGTGIGVGVISEGRVIRGAHGIAGAAGWFGLTPIFDARYADVGCWEAEAAGPAIARHAGAPDAEAAVRAARNGDPVAIEALNRAAGFIGMGVANLVSVLDPEVVVLGGGVMHGAGDLLIDRIRAEGARWAQPIAWSRCRIEPSRLGETAGLLGAARLALDLLE